MNRNVRHPYRYTPNVDLDLSHHMAWLGHNEWSFKSISHSGPLEIKPLQFISNGDDMQTPVETLTKLEDKERADRFLKKRKEKIAQSMSMISSYSQNIYSGVSNNQPSLTISTVKKIQMLFHLLQRIPCRCTTINFSENCTTGKCSTLICSTLQVEM